MTFAYPLILWLLLLCVPIVLWHYLVRRHRRPTLQVSTTDAYADMKPTWRSRLAELPFWLRLLCFALVVVVLARPQTHSSLTNKETEGIDILLAVDISTSMLTPDLQPSRIEAAKKMALEFINSRPNDRIGLVLFGGEAFLQCPLTTDHATLLSMFQNITCRWQEAGIIAPGTAIGMGISSSISHLQTSQAKSKVVILLTDGENNAGEISPLTAAEMAQQSDVRIYTILVGTNGVTNQAVAVLPNGEVYSAPIDTSVDPSTLKEIARLTGGLFYAADSNDRLRDIYKDIDKLEKTKLQLINKDQRHEVYQPFALLALIVLLLELLLRHTLWRRLPE
ncbi:MAG: VWA domain-containing protein [Alloprevotella sp.]|nr:VWA domain-containing protein [Alloprevotella sp.]